MVTAWSVCCTVWGRWTASSSAGSADCIPREMRLKPARRSRRRERRSTLSGLASRVISASLSTGSCFFRAVKISFSRFSPYRLGVPPPK